MPITREIVVHTARLARLELTDDEIDRLGAELTQITDYIAQLSEAVTGDTPVAPLSHLHADAEALREDQVQPNSVGKSVLAHAPDSEGPFFRVPKVIE